MAEFQTYNLGNVLSKAEQIKTARFKNEGFDRQNQMRNVLRESQGQYTPEAINQLNQIDPFQAQKLRANNQSMKSNDIGYRIKAFKWLKLSAPLVNNQKSFSAWRNKAIANGSMNKEDMGDIYDDNTKNQLKTIIGEANKKLSGIKSGMNPNTGKPGFFTMNKANGKVQWLDGPTPIGKKGISSTKAPTIREFKVGDKIVTKQWNNKTLQWDDMAESQRKSSAPTVKEFKSGNKIITKQWNPINNKWETMSVTDKNKKKLPSNKQSNVLRRQYLAQSKKYKLVLEHYARIKVASKDPSAAGDLALIFAYMKMLDPESVVRESEQAMAANARGVPETIRTMYNRVLSGERLGLNQRKDFVSRAKMIMNASGTMQKNREKEFSRLSKQYKVNPKKVIVNLGSTGQFDSSLDKEDAKKSKLVNTDSSKMTVKQKEDFLKKLRGVK